MAFEIKDNLLSSFGLIFLYCIIVLAVIMVPAFAFPGMVKHPDGSPKPLLWWLVGVGCILFMTVPFYLGIRRMAVWAEPAKKPAKKAEVIDALLKFNSDKYPVEVKRQPKYDLVVKTKLADSKWKGVLFRGGLKKDYTMYLKFDEDKKEAYCVEHTRSVSWDVGAGPGAISASVRWNCFYGILLFDKEKMKIYDPLKLFRKAADISYNISEVKWPLFHIIVGKGWTIRPRLFPVQVRK